MIRAAILAAAIFALWPTTAPAFVTFQGEPRWLTAPAYTTDPGLETETATAISHWSAVSGFHSIPGGLDIEVRLEMPPDPEAGGWARIWGTPDRSAITHCIISVNPIRWAADYPGDRQTILDHEMGHCFGLNHSDVYASIMGLGYTWSIDDTAGARYLYGPPRYRTFAGGLTKED